MALDQARARNINDAIHGVAAFTAPSGSMKVRLTTSVGTSTANGTEVAAGGGYSTGGVVVTYTASTAATPTVTNNSGALNYTNMPRAESIAGVEVTDSTPTRLEFGGLTGGAKAVAAGDTFSIAASALTSALQ